MLLVKYKGQMVKQALLIYSVLHMKYPRELPKKILFYALYWAYLVRPRYVGPRNLDWVVLASTV